MRCGRHTLCSLACRVFAAFGVDGIALAVAMANPVAGGRGGGVTKIRSETERRK
jgi:hypothetical protein